MPLTLSILRCLLRPAFALLLINAATLTLHADTFGDYTYTDDGTSITITDYPTNAVGAVVIPASIIGKPVTSIGSSAFQNCSSLTSITIPASTTSIGNSAFSQCSGLTSVTIPNSVTSIGSDAFASCSSLTSVTIPDSVTSIREQTFYSCSSLTGIIIPTSVTSIGFRAFSYCASLTSVTIPNSVTSIESSAFSDCNTLASAVIGSGVTSIGDGAFIRCAGLMAITVDELNAHYTGVAGTLFNKSQTLLIRFPQGLVGSYMIPNSVTSIGSYAFIGCAGLTSVTLGNSVTSIGIQAFLGCSGLASVTFSNSVTSIASSAFNGCTGLTSVTLGNGVTSIGTSAFSGCTGLASVTLGNSVTSIGTNAFSGCTGVTSVTLGTGVTSIGNSAFLNCTSLTIIYIKGNAPSLGTTVFPTNPKSNVYYLLGTAGWTSTFGGLGTVALGLPTITAQPSSVIANVGENAAFSVIAKTTIPLTLGYQWQRNGLPIPGATAASLYLNNIQPANVGTYTVIITNDSGSVASTVTLTITQGELYTQAQYESALQLGLTIGLQAGRTQVTDSPNSYGLYSLTQVQALNVGTPLLTKDQVSGKFKLTIGAKKSANLSTYTALPFSSGGTTINAQGEMEFQFTSPDNAAFFRLESH